MLPALAAFNSDSSTFLAGLRGWSKAKKSFLFILQNQGCLNLLPLLAIIVLTYPLIHWLVNAWGSS